MSKEINNYLDKEELLQEIIKIQTDPNADKTLFATQCMLIINNLKKSPKFAGYTSNWTEDYISNSIYKMLKYIHNFDHTKISKITGEPVSPFAYLTQIAKAAFIEVINRRKKEERNIKETVQYRNLEDLPENLSKGVNEHKETTKEEYKKDVKEYSLRTLSFEGKKYDSVYEILKTIHDRGERKIKLIYPKKYVISLDEYEKITNIGKFEYLSLTRKTYNQKKKDEDLEEEIDSDILEMLKNDLEEWEYNPYSDEEGDDE